MNISKRFLGRWLNWTILFMLLLTLSGCAASKFTATTEADVGFFADNTIAMLKSANLGFSRGTAIYTKEFYDLDAPEEKRWLRNRDQADFILQVMVQYSLKLVQIAEAEPTHAGRVGAYADYLAGLDDKALEALDITREELEELLSEIRKQEKFMEALQVAQPVINAMGRYMSNVLDEFGRNHNTLIAKTERRIDERYDLVIEYQKGLEIEKYSVLRALGELYGAAQGDMVAYERLKASKALVKKSVIPRGKPTYEDIEKIAEYLIKKLDGLHRIQQEIEPDWKLYRATQRELDELHKLFIEEIRQFRLITIVWMRAHQKMASGKVKAAEWFDINNAPGTLIKMGTGIL